MSAPRRYRPRGAHAPARPAEMKRRRSERIPVGQDMWDWRPNELVLGPSPKRDSFWQRLESLYGRGQK
jgi:hypothetical protein